LGIAVIIVLLLFCCEELELIFIDLLICMRMLETDEIAMGNFMKMGILMDLFPLSGINGGRIMS
jgi:hypothetical protein